MGIGTMCGSCSASVKSRGMLDKFCTCTHERDVPALSMCVCQPYFVMLDTGVHLHPISCQSGYLYSCLTHRQRAQGGGRASLTMPIRLPRGTLTALLSPPRLSQRYRTMTGHDSNITTDAPLYNKP